MLLPAIFGWHVLTTRLTVSHCSLFNIDLFFYVTGIYHENVGSSKYSESNWGDWWPQNWQLLHGYFIFSLLFYLVRIQYAGPALIYKISFLKHDSVNTVFDQNLKYLLTHLYYIVLLLVWGWGALLCIMYLIYHIVLLFVYRPMT